MNSKAILIAIAAFAVTTTGASAYGGNILSRAGLNEDQIEAVEEARELRAAGKITEARDKLVEAGITEDQLRSMHRVASNARDAIRDAIENENYDAFVKAAADFPISDIITTELDFKQFCEAHELRQSGDWKEADEIMEDLGFEDKRPVNRHAMSDFSFEQREALRVARQSNDRATIQAIFDEAGYELRLHHRGGR
jgi:ABC-type ATPase with predicted acetyltransferase domain